MKRDSYKSFSSKVADSNSPYKPLRVVPKDSPLTPWKAKAREDGLQPANVVSKDSPLVALGKDGKPLDGSGETDFTNLSPKLEEYYYKKAFSKALEKPHLFRIQEKDNAKPREGKFYLLLNVPSIDESGTPVVVGISKARMLIYMIQALTEDSKLAEKFFSSLRDQIPKGYSPGAPPVISSSLARQAKAKTKGKLSTSSAKDIGPIEYIYDPTVIIRSCCNTAGLLHPDWYYGFVRDSSITIEGNSNIDRPRGKIIFGPRPGCHAELPIFLPDSNNTEYTIPLSTHFHHNPPTIDVHNSPDQLELERAMDDLLNFYGAPGSGIERTIICWLILSCVGMHPSDRGIDTVWEQARGVIMIWNEAMWRCCLVPVDHDPGAKRFNGDVFDQITISLDNDSNNFSISGSDTEFGFGEIDDMSILQVYRLINHVEIVLNQETILNNDFNYPMPHPPFALRPGFPLTLTRSLVLDSFLSEYKADSIMPTSYDSPPWRPFLSYIQPYNARMNDLVLAATNELGQGWNPKYGAEWERLVFSGGGQPITTIWAQGSRNWCSSFSNWLLRQAHPPGSPAPFNDLIEISRVYIHQLRELFEARGLYIAPRSEYGPFNVQRFGHPRVRWGDLNKWVKPGYWVRLRDNARNPNGNPTGAHVGIFLYWTRPPAQLPNDPFNQSDTRNDPFNEYHTDWDDIAGYFDPSLTYNRFKCIAGNTHGRVNILNYTIARIPVDISSSVEDYKNERDKIAQRVNWHYFNPSNDDDPNFVFTFLCWRNETPNPDGTFFDTPIDVIGDAEQDGFGITYGKSHFWPTK